MFPTKNSIFHSQTTWCLLYLLNPTTAVRRQPQKIGQFMGMAVFHSFLFCFVLQWHGGSSLTSPAHFCFTSPQRRRGAPLSVQYLSVSGFSIFAKSTSVNILFSSVDAGNTLTCNSLTTQPHFSSSAEQTLPMHSLSLLNDDAHLRELI